MATRVCYHCKQEIDDSAPHDCWTTTEAALTADLSEDLQEAWERLREEAVELGDQRVYASHSSIMFSRTSCYFFVRPKKQFLELCVFLGRTVAGPAVRRSAPSSRTKVAHTLHIRHRDEVEAPITDWLREAYEWAGLTEAERRAVRASETTAAPGTTRVRSKRGAAKGVPEVGQVRRTGTSRTHRPTGRQRVEAAKKPRKRR